MTLEQYIRDHSTVTDFAAKIDRSRMQVHRYMRGENLSKRIMDKICVATDGLVPPASFFNTTNEAAE